MKTIEINSLSIEEIRQKLKDYSIEYEHMKFNHKVSSLRNPIGLKNKRRLISRISTVLQQKLKKMASQ